MQWFSGKSQRNTSLKRAGHSFSASQAGHWSKLQPWLTHRKFPCKSTNDSKCFRREKMGSFLQVRQITQKGNNFFSECINLQKFSKIEGELKNTVSNTGEICHPIALSSAAVCGDALALVSSITSDLGWTGEQESLGNCRNLTKLLRSLLQWLQHCYCSI